MNRNFIICNIPLHRHSIYGNKLRCIISGTVSELDCSWNIAYEFYHLFYVLQILASYVTQNVVMSCACKITQANFKRLIRSTNDAKFQFFFCKKWQRNVKCQVAQSQANSNFTFALFSVTSYVRCWKRSSYSNLQCPGTISQQYYFQQQALDSGTKTVFQQKRGGFAFSKSLLFCSFQLFCCLSLCTSDQKMENQLADAFDTGPFQQWHVSFCTEMI